MPYDNLRLRDGSRNIRDDDFEKWLARLGERTDNVIVSMDSCHSGTATRSVQTVQARGTTEKQPAAATQNQQDQDAAPGGWVASSNESLRYVFLAAADSHQLAYEAPTARSGARWDASRRPWCRACGTSRSGAPMAICG